MSIFSDTYNDTKFDTIDALPELDLPGVGAPPPARRSPLMAGTYKLNSHSICGAKSNPFTKSVKGTLTVMTVSASLLGAFSTIASFASNISPQAPLVNNKVIRSLGASAVSASADSIDGPLSAMTTAGKVLGHCPLRHTTMDAKLSAYVARVNITQVFTNPYSERIEAVYNLPLSDDAAVDEMTIKIGERTIKGEIKTRGDAKRVYDTAKKAGQAAVLLDQQRTNIFTQHIANIEPGKSIIVQVSYVELLKFEDGRYTFTMPTTIGPRFYPDANLNNSISNASNSLAAILPGNASAGAIAGHNLSINVDVDAGLPIKNVSSKLFPILVDRQSSSHSLVTLQKSINLPNKDFVLTYELDKSDSIKSGYLAYRDLKSKDKGGYATFMLLPPAKVTNATACPKEMIFLLDCSGSQAGRPIEKAKETLHYIVDHMNANDTFQVLAFNNEVETLSEHPVQAGVAEKLQAHNFINGLNAGGGTWMAPAVERVLKQSETADKDFKRLRIVTFMTDGFVGNDLEIMSLVQKKRADSRWFTFGTGDSVNHTLINNVARLGGGEADYVLLGSSAEEAGKKFYSHISSPVLTDVKLEAEGLELYDVYPATVCDVWANKPLYFTARYKGARHGKVVLTGYAQGRPYSQTLNVNLPEEDTANSALEKVWAGQKIRALTDLDLIGLANNQVNQKVKNEITKLALDHKIMSDFTSFVAVDTAFTKGVGWRTVTVPNILPDGVESQYSAITTVGYMPGGGSGAIQGATNGTIGPEGSNFASISGINTSGTVRVNNLANLEALLNIMANGIEILGLAWGGLNLIQGLISITRDPRAWRKALYGSGVIAAALSTPGMINWFIGVARDANLFN